MGKNSLIKSTSKKKKNQKKPEEQGVAVIAEEPEPAAKPKVKTTPAKKEPPKTPTAKPTYTELIFKKFTDRLPERSLSVAGSEKKRGQYEAPPFYSAKIQAEIKQFKKLLFKKFDLTRPVEADAEKPPADEQTGQPAPVAQTVPAREPPTAIPVKPTYTDLIFKKFTDQQPKKSFFSVHQGTKHNRYEAPPFYSAKIQAEIKQFKELLFKKFELPGPVEADVEKSPADEHAIVPEPAVASVSTEKTVLPVKPTPPLKRPTPDRKVIVSYADAKAATPSDPRDNLMKLALAVFAFFVVVLIGASFSNRGTYHLTTGNGKIEVWQGRFGPMGKTLLATLPDAAMTDTVKSRGSKKEIFPFIVAYYLEKADRGLETSQTPDFREIRSLLSAAAPFAATSELKKEILSRTNLIDLTSLLYKAQVAAGLQTAEGFAEALTYLESAKSIRTDNVQSELVALKIQSIKESLADLGLPAAGPEKAR